MNFSKLYTYNKSNKYLNEICISDYEIYLQDIDFLAYKNNCHIEAIRVKNLYFNLLVNGLNKIHNTKHDSRYWKILIGHWYERFCNVFVNRYGNISELLKKHSLNTIESIEVSNDDFTPTTTLDSYVKFSNEAWNSAFYSYILATVNPNLDFTFNTLKKDIRINLKTDKITFRYKIYRLYELLSSFLLKNHDIFIISSYFRYIDDFLVQIMLKQVPRFWRTPSIQIINRQDYLLRYNFSEYLTNNIPENNKHGKLFINLLIKSIPIAYLESYKTYVNSVEGINFPKFPRIIFTSNNFDTDDIFKFWLICKLQNPDCKYIVGQHGNNYFTNKYTGITVEESTADKFVTWGCAPSGDKYINGFNYKVSNKRINHSKVGGLLWVSDTRGLLDKSWNVDYEYDLYFRNQISFFNLLDKNIFKTTIARLHSSYKLWGYDEDVKLSKLYPYIKINNGTGSIFDLYTKSRMVVHSYDSTGLLECLTLNIPCIAFWVGEYDHINDKYKSHYKTLHKAGIIHFSAESAANHIKLIWNDIDSWWLSSNVQMSKNFFCEYFSRSSSKPLRNIKEFFL